MCFLGVEGSEKKCAPPEDNFWNSPNPYSDLVVVTDGSQVFADWKLEPLSTCVATAGINNILCRNFLSCTGLSTGCVTTSLEPYRLIGVITILSHIDPQGQLG